MAGFLASEAKEQVLANLANFAYDPNNMEYLKQLQVTDLFLDMLTEENDNFVEFGMGKERTATPAKTMKTSPTHCSPTVCVCVSGGLCNLSMDPECRDIILQSSGLSLVTNCLSSPREETVLSAITTLMNLVQPSSRADITAPAIVQCMLRFSLSDSPRLRNLAAVFLQDCCSQEQVEQAQRQMQGQQTAVGIPLPRD